LEWIILTYDTKTDRLRERERDGGKEREREKTHSAEVSCERTFNFLYTWDRYAGAMRDVSFDF